MQTYAQYWNIKKLRSYARIDLGHVNLKPEDRSMLAQRFHFAPHGQGAPALHTAALLHRIAAVLAIFVPALPRCWGSLPFIFVAKNDILSLFSYSSRSNSWNGTNDAFSNAPGACGYINRHLSPHSCALPFVSTPLDRLRAETQPYNRELICNGWRRNALAAHFAGATF